MAEPRLADRFGINAFDEVTEFSTRLREARIALWSWPYPDRDFAYKNFLAPVKSAKQGTCRDTCLDVLAMQSGGGLLETSSELAAMIGKCIERGERLLYVDV